jgi:hypothetical protein
MFGVTYFYRECAEIYIKELAMYLARLDYTWVKNAFCNTLTAALEGLTLT